MDSLESRLPARLGRLRRWVGPGLIVLGAFAAAWLVLMPLVFGPTPGWGYDFEAYLLAAQRLGRGDPLYLSWTLDGPFRPGPFGLYLYAPPLAVAILPMTALSVPAATLLWFAARAALLLAACALMPVRPRVRLLILVLAVLSEPVLTDLNLGNVSLVVMFLSVVGWRFLDRPAGSVALAVAMTVRPTFGLFLVWWLLRRRWRALAWALAAGALAIALTLPFVRVDVYLDYVRLVRNLADVTGVPNNMDLGSTAARLGLGGALSTLALLGGYAIAIAAVIFSLRRDREVSFMVTLGATLLLSPLLWDHYLVNALLPAAFLIERGRRWGLALGVLVLLWVPAPGVPLLAVAATLAPLLARPRPVPTYAATPRDTPSEDAPALDPAASNRTVAPA
ncbi:MAG: alpha,2-mannosyltransferase [Chloroflexota bacterium]|jgi:hypothetical protein|nr:alpha,2-mannosyltransferase [Chloroflexota bacterium]